MSNTDKGSKQDTNSARGNGAKGIDATSESTKEAKEAERGDRSGTASRPRGHTEDPDRTL